MTANQLIALALVDTGAFGDGQTPTAANLANGLTRLNMLLAQWQRKRWLVWNLVDSAILSQGKESYTVGIGGDINILRPDRLEFAYVRQIGTLGENPNFPNGGQQFISGVGTPTTADILEGTCILWLNTTTQIMSVYCNVGGVIVQGSALGLYSP